MPATLPNAILKTAIKCMVLLAIVSVMPAGAARAATASLTLEGGELVGDSDTFRFTEGDEIIILWTSDESVELHLHGYDLTVPVARGEPGEMRFTGSITGRFPVTSHGSTDSGPGGHRALIYIEIYPE